LFSLAFDGARQGMTVPMPGQLEIALPSGEI
jgi:hypothetical protein